MATQAALTTAEWDVAALHWEHGPSPVQCVFCRVRGGEWQPWVIVARSAIMQRVGQHGLGLYAAKSFHRDDFVGAYDGQVVGTFASRDAALASPACVRLVRRGHDKLITRGRRHGAGVELVDGDTGGAPYLHRINDPRGTRLGPNVQLTPGGWFRVTQRRVPAFDLARGVDENIAAELRFSYGDEYWRTIGRLGRDAAHAIEL